MCKDNKISDQKGAPIKTQAELLVTCSELFILEPMRETSRKNVQIGTEDIFYFNFSNDAENIVANAADYYHFWIRTCDSKIPLRNSASEIKNFFEWTLEKLVFSNFAVRLTKARVSTPRKIVVAIPLSVRCFRSEAMNHCHVGLRKNKPTLSTTTLADRKILLKLESLSKIWGWVSNTSNFYIQNYCI